MKKPTEQSEAGLDVLVKPLFKVLNSNGKLIGQTETFKEACDMGMSISPNSDFMIKEGTRKAEIINIAFRNWHKWWTSPERKVVRTDDGFRLV